MTSHNVCSKLTNKRQHQNLIEKLEENKIYTQTVKKNNNLSGF